MATSAKSLSENPKGTPRGTVEIAIETCKGCELCVDACPQESLKMSGKINTFGYHYAVLVEDNCTGCVNCALVCPDATITVYRTKKPAKGASAKEAIATISNVKGNLRFAIGENSAPEVPVGGVSI